MAPDAETHSGLCTYMDEPIEYRGIIVRRRHAADLEWDREHDILCVLEVINSEKVDDEPVLSLNEAFAYLHERGTISWIEEMGFYNPIREAA